MAATPPGATLNDTLPEPSPREFLPGAREKLLALLSSSPSLPGAVGSENSPAAGEMWSGVLGVVLESAKAQGDWGLAQALVGAGAEVGHLDLHEAIEGGHTDYAAVLVNHGASVDAEDEELCTPLHIAAKQDSAEIAQLLLQKGANMESPSITPLCLAAMRGSAAVVEVLMLAGADPHGVTELSSLSPFDAAADRGHDGVLKVMIRLGADVSATTDEYGDTALHVANGTAVVGVLIEAGADVEARNDLGLTPLLSAASGRRIEAVRALVNHGADINAKGPHGKTPLHRAAAHTAWIGIEVVDFLLRSGADETLVDKYGRTPADEIKGYFAKDKANVERARKLLAEAPVDRTWRRRGLLLMCIARHGRGQLPGAASDISIPGDDTEGTSNTETSGNDVVEERPEGGWAGVSGWLAGLKPLQEGILRKIIEFV